MKIENGEPIVSLPVCRLQLSMAESSRDQGLHVLYKELADAKALLSKLDEAAHR